MKDLKENIKKNNMKILAISMALCMLCCCANNAMKKPIEINEVLMTMLEGQNNINEAKKAFKKQEPRIYSTIKDGKSNKIYQNQNKRHKSRQVKICYEKNRTIFSFRRKRK